MSKAYFMASATSQTKCCFHRPYFDKAIIRTSYNIMPGAIKSSCGSRNSANSITSAKRGKEQMDNHDELEKTTREQKADVAFVEDTIGKQ
jgi:hypothetical protein